MKTDNYFKVISLLLIGAVLFSQCSGTKETQVARVQIPGTYVSIVPAPGFELAPEIGGFKHTSSAATIMVLETPKTYESVLAEITKEKMAKDSTVLFSNDTASIQGYKGMLYQTSKSSNNYILLRWVLLLPVQGHALTVNGTFLQEDEKTLSEDIKKALLSTRLSVTTNDKNVLDFTIDADSLKLAKILEGPSIMFTRNGTWDEPSIFDLSFFAGPSTIYQAADVGKTKEFAIWQLKEVCADCQVVKDGVHSVTIDSLKGFEVVGLSKDSITGAIKRLKYAAVLFDSTQFYLLVGTSTKNSEDRIEMFKTISRSFRKKDKI